MPIEPHKASSVSFKVIDNKVKQALQERSLLDNTIQVATPFVRVTSTIQHSLLGKGNKGFTLGLHATKEDVKYQDIFSENGTQSGKKYPLIGYTYTPDGKNKLIYASPPGEQTGMDKAAKINKLFDNDTELFSTTDQTFVPPPGITKVSVTRGKAGLLIAADISFSVPKLSQLEILHRLFLVPGIGIVLEWGQQFAPEGVNNKDGNYGEIGLPVDKLRDKMFPWYNPAKRDALFERLGDKKVGVEEIMNCYAYETQGQYMWMFGRVGNFSTKTNSDGSFECSMKIVGPSEDSWAFSTTRTVTPPADPTTQKPCAQSANSAHSYFSKTTSGPNLKTLLDDVLSGKGKAKDWKKHVKKLPKATGREPNAGTTTPTESEKSFGDSEDAYFMTWRFFVNVVLNHPDVGVKRVFKEAQVSEDIIKKIAILKPYTNDPEAKTPLIEAPGPQYIDDPYETFVGYNKYLRSIDPSTLLIISEKAAVESKAKFNPQRQEKNPPDYFKETTLSRSFKEVGLFEKSTTGIKTPAPQSDDKLDRGCLSAGVWINHKAVVASMVAGETILRGVSNLLDRMNKATNNYWNLTLDSSEPTGYQCEGSPGSSPGKDMSTFTWTVIDSNYKENSIDAANNFLNNIHVFNKYVRKNKEGQLVGSEVTDCTVDLALPKVLFSQIATMGLVQKKDLQSAGIEPEQPNHRCSDPAISDANEALREMFAITSISQAEAVLADGPDLTAKIKKPEKTQCSDTNSTTPGAVTGQGTQVDGTNANSQALPAAGESANREFPGMENAFRYIEAFPELMTANIRCDGNGFKSNAFGAAPGALSINADLTLPGLAGFRIGELFWIDRIPSFYKAFGAFQIVSIEDSIDVSNGWTTKIGAKFNYLGPAWTTAVCQLAGLALTPEAPKS